MERLELPLERDHLDRRRVEVAVDGGDDDDVDVARLGVDLPGRHRAEELVDAAFGGGLVGALGALGPLLEERLLRADDRDRPVSSMTVVSVETSIAPRRQASIWPIDLPWFDSPPRNRTVLSR